jgi:hypothetical protein
MAKRISELTILPNAEADANDSFPIVDSANGETKRMRLSDLDDRYPASAAIPGLEARVEQNEDDIGDLQDAVTDLESDVNDLELGKQNDVVTTKGDLVIGNDSGEASRLGVGVDGTVLIADDAEPGGLRWGQAPGGSGQGEKSYFENGEFEDTEGVSVYDDGGAYVDGEGGSPSALSVDVTTDAAKVLSGNTSQETPSSLVIEKAASDASGEGVTFAIAELDAIDVGKTLFGRFAVDASDANYPGGDLTLHAYDVAAGEELPVRVQGIADDNSIPALKGMIHFHVETTEATTGQIRLSLHCETDNADTDAWELIVDALVFGPQSRVIVEPSYPIEFVPVMAPGFGAVTNALFRGQRRGS